MPQWSLRTLLIATATVPVACYVLVRASALFAAIAVLSLFGVWIASMVVALVGKREHRAFAAGLLVTITIYGGIAFSQGSFELRGAKLFTSRLLYHAHEASVVRTMSPVEVSGATPLPAPLGGVPTSNSIVVMMVTGEMPTPEHFAIVGHVYWAILFGIVGGWIAHWMAGWERRLIDSRPNDQPGETQAVE